MKHLSIYNCIHVPKQHSNAAQASFLVPPTLFLPLERWLRGIESNVAAPHPIQTRGVPLDPPKPVAAPCGALRVLDDLVVHTVLCAVAYKENRVVQVVRIGGAAALIDAPAPIREDAAGDVDAHCDGLRQQVGLDVGFVGLKYVVILVDEPL